MVDFAKARVVMVDCQIRTVDVTDYSVLDAFAEVPREHFVPDHLKALAYIDEDLLVTDAGAPPRYIMEAGPLARLVQLADILPGERVLDIGCTTGYAAAILSRLAKDVVALEEDSTLVERARVLLAEFGAGNVTVAAGPLAAGHAAGAPYDVILVEGAVEQLPDAIFEQLTDRGRLVTVVGSHGLSARAMIYTKAGGAVSGRPVFNTYVRPLLGFARPKQFVF